METRFIQAFLRSGLKGIWAVGFMRVSSLWWLKLASFQVLLPSSTLGLDTCAILPNMGVCVQGVG